MTTLIEYVNIALGSIGVSDITSLDDANARASIMKARVNVARRSVLEETYWLFARKAVSIPADATTPTDSYFSTRYPLPTDYLKFWYIDGHEDWPHQIQESWLLSNAGPPITLIYTHDVTELGRWPTKVGEVFAARLAMLAAYKLTGQQKNVDKAKEHYQDAVSAARHNNAVQSPLESLDADEWLASRGQAV